MEQFTQWTDQTIEHWKSKNIKLKAGTTPEKIKDIESVLAFQFPADFTELYLKVNGFVDGDSDENMFTLWPIERIWEEFHAHGDSDYIAFCDYLINSHTIGYDKSDGLIYKDYHMIEPIANNFQEFILLLNGNDDRLY
jgi:hypothetical protein